VGYYASVSQALQHFLVPVEPAAAPVPVLEQESVLDLSAANRQR